MSLKTGLLLGTGLALLAACGEQDVVLPGERFDIREGVEALENQTSAVNLATPVSNSDWTHRNGAADHTMRHPALRANLTQTFSISIGEGDDRRARITSDPVAEGGVIFTLDARARVQATSASGSVLWVADVTPGSDGADDASGGGLAVADGQVYVSSGFGELTVLDATSGQEIWTQDLNAPGTSAPTVYGGLVYVVAKNATAWALDVNTGRIEWQVNGLPTVSSFGGGSGVAVNDDIAVIPFASGEVVGTFPKGGLRRWSAAVAGTRLGQAASLIGDISGDPVISNGRVFVGNTGGQLAALDIANGEVSWTASHGSIGPVWPAGNSVFFVNDINQLVRLEATAGTSIWSVDLPKFGEESTSKRRSQVAHYGPILAGGRLIVASTDGLLRSFDPASGAMTSSLEIPDGAASAPIVVAGVLYVVSKSGQLLAFR